MFLIDDLLLTPVTGVLGVFREIRAAAEEETIRSADALRAELAELYRQLETGRISPDQFDEQEKVLLDRLDSAVLQQPPVNRP